MKDFIKKQIDQSYQTKKLLVEDGNYHQLICEVCEKAIETYQNGKKILLAGNGGSAADAQHLAGELVSRFYFDRPGLPALALTTDTSILTAIGNDYGYESIFSRQIEANGYQGDLFIGLSTSGNSLNVIKAMEACKDKGIITVGLTGITGGKLAGYCDYCIKVPSAETPRIQETHILIGHIICAAIEDALFGKNVLSDETTVKKKRED
jgi:D-sedoheptulose 7-phosphate isomerase